MLFPTVEYALFFMCAFIGAWGLARTGWAHNAFLLAMSWGFYAFGDWRFLPLLVGIALEAALVAKALEAESTPNVRRVVLTVGVSSVLLTLVLFKYLGFAASIMLTALHNWGVHGWAPRVPELALPVGISFFTFHAISLMVDAWHRRIPVRVKVVDALLYVAFFPQLVAGPILRASSFLKALATPRRVGSIDTAFALQRLSLGLFKKVILAHLLASTLVDPVFESPLDHSGLQVLLAVYGYAAQIYCDFSGYTDLAIGSAALLGYSMPENFHAPYLAANPQDFWRRWHMSLSSWLRDYLFIPLGGSRRGTLRTVMSLFITMVLGGLWHGAAWTFVAWGAFHGAGLVAHRAWAGLRAVKPIRDSAAWAWVAPVLTFHFVCAGWVLFRSTSLSQAGEVLSALTATTPWALNPWSLALVAIALGVSCVPPDGLRSFRSSFSRLPWPTQGLCFGLLVVGIDAFSPRGIAPFIYFQF
jgi:alginate O-acetyltransferase complex protein AlgI